MILDISWRDYERHMTRPMSLSVQCTTQLGHISLYGNVPTIVLMFYRRRLCRKKINVSDSSYQNRGIMKEISSFSRINAKRLLLKSICSPNPIHKCLPFWPFFNVQLTSFPSLLLAAGWDSTCCCCFECWSDSTCSPTHLCPEQNELMDR